ncbi:D-glutamate cyclase, mitochondrial-like [Protopterus annectens]|uniref:D-glutamate cyclase, mitochondrial-like n=1 Tax=Protopterus annectens TaxID=7888 RepID=UPI001CFB89AE|nr:D-glutamate cyclase, mitochondrial-like [Protopterus annectens]
MQLHHHVDPTDGLFVAAQTIPGMTTTGKMQLHHHVDPTDGLFLAAQTIPGMTTTGKMQLHYHVDPTDGLLVAAQTIPGMTTTGFSDWGRYAVACALYILSSCEIHDRYLRKAVGFPRKTQMNNLASALPSVNKEEKLMEILTKHCEQIRKTGSLGMEVQSLSLHTLHYSMIQKLLEESLTKHLS